MDLLDLTPWFCYDLVRPISRLFFWIIVPSSPHSELEQNRLSNMSFALGVHALGKTRHVKPGYIVL
jgi:hypothetical protein